MTFALRYNGRLPGVVCDATLPPPGEPPITLDVAGLAGFAERGPLNLPVAVEDLSQYRAVFGGDLALARRDGPPVFAQLPRAVQSFFDNGGRRCYVVRVAGAEAIAGTFRLPGLVAFGPEGARLTRLAAAWVGRWSDGLSVGATLRGLPLRAGAYSLTADGLALDLELPADLALRQGDLLRLRGDAAGLPLAYAVVDSLDPTIRDGQPLRPVSALRGLPVTARATSVVAYATAGALPTLAGADRLGFAGWEPLADGPLWLEPEGARVVLRIAAEVGALRPGDLLRLRVGGGGEALLVAEEVDIETADASPAEAPLLAVHGATLLHPLAAGAPLGVLRQAELLSFDLDVREGAATELWPDRRFAPGVGGWAEVLAQTPFDGLPAGQIFLEGLPPDQSPRLRLNDLAGADFYLPLAMPELPDPARRARRLPDAAEPAERDGLKVFAPGLLLDAEMAAMTVGTIAAEAERRLFLAEPREPLRGVHALLPIDEVALIALPDASHRPWGPPESVAPDKEPPPPPQPPPLDWSRFLNCKLGDPPPPPAPPLPDPCGQPFDPGPPEGEGLEPDLRQQLAALPVLSGPAGYDSAPLLAAQAALARLCAAKSDALALLSLPEHFGARDALDWGRGLVAAAPDLLSGATLSYAAAYHPWLLFREETAPELALLRATPPDGAVCGMIAARARERGPWVAPANQALRGVVGLAEQYGDGDWGDLFDAQLNIVRRQPGRFTLLSAHTLSRDRQLVQISVRRLIILLRKVALRRGMRYVFEPNSGRFRELVRLSFDRLLRELAGRGAVVAYEVVTGPEVNTPNDEDNGRLIIAIKVAPTLPIGFITVVLRRRGEGLLEFFER